MKVPFCNIYKNCIFLIILECQWKCSKEQNKYKNDSSKYRKMTLKQIGLVAVARTDM